MQRNPQPTSPGARQRLGPAPARSAPRACPGIAQPGPGAPAPRKAQGRAAPQAALTNEEAAQPPPKRWVVILKRICLGVLGLLALALVYVFLLLGEPDSMAVEAPPLQEEKIRVPMAAIQATGSADLPGLAASFGKPILALYGGLSLQKCTLYDTAFQGTYARRAVLEYAFEDGQMLLVESLRPAQAVALLEAGRQASLSLYSLYALAGIDAVRMDNPQSICIFGQQEGAVYAVTCPKARSGDLAALLKQTTLLQPKAPGS